MKYEEAINRRDVAVGAFHRASLALDLLAIQNVAPVDLAVTTWRGILHACGREVTRCDNSIRSHEARL